jgi:glycosyltransferase involved in cell wall biosynthesis
MTKATKKKTAKKKAAKKTTAKKAVRKKAAKKSPRRRRTVRRPKIKNVMIAIPSYDGRVGVHLTNGLLQAAEHCAGHGIRLFPQFRINDSLVQRARNDLFADAVGGFNENGKSVQFDAMIFIDDDMQFDPAWIFDLLMCDRDVVGGCARKKTDDQELYNIKTANLEMDKEGLIQVFGLGTGFVKLSNKAFTALWDNSAPYDNDGRLGRMVCDVQVVEGQLYSEDTYMYLKLSQLGFQAWLNPHMTCGHVGTKLFQGNFIDYRNRLITGSPT